MIIMVFIKTGTHLQTKTRTYILMRQSKRATESEEAMKLIGTHNRMLEDAKARGVPLVIPAGNIEYHGPHCVCGCDTLIVEGIANLLEQEKEIVVAPTAAYCPSTWVASGPEMNTLSMDMSGFERHAHGILRGLLEGGWKNIKVLIHHQYDRELLFPMTLSWMSSGKQALFERMEALHGRGWYARIGNDPHEMDYKRWISVMPVMSREVQERTGYDHAGKYECSLLMALYPGQGLVLPEQAADAGEWFAESAAGANEKLGRKMIAEILADLKEKIG